MTTAFTLAPPGALAAPAARPLAGPGELAASWRARLDALAQRSGGGDLAAARAALASPEAPGASLHATAQRQPSPAHASAATHPTAQAPGVGEAARAALDGLERARGRLDAAIAAARRGQTFTAGELLALQSDAYRFGQTVDLAARAVESGAQAVRQAVQTPLG